MTAGGVGVGFVRTVTGDVDSGSLGPVDYHEHLFQISPLLPGDELSDEERSGREAGYLRDAGFGAMVEATPRGLGADPAAVARISQSTGLAIVHATGAHRAGHYASDHPLLSADADTLADRFTADVLCGIDETGVRAGLVKAGADYWRISGFTERVLHAAGIAHVRTGAPLMVHTESGSAGHEILDILEAEGVSAECVVLAHMDRNPDPGLHIDLASRGAILGYDGWARHRDWPDSVLIDCMARVVSDPVGAASVVIGGDVARASRYRAYGGIPGLEYLPLRVVPRLHERLGAAAAEAVTTSNPARWLTFTAPAGA